MSPPIDISEDAPINAPIYDMSSTLLSPDYLTCTACHEILADDFGQGSCGHLACGVCWEMSDFACATCKTVSSKPRYCNIIGAVLKAYPRKAPCGAVFYWPEDHYGTCVGCCRLRSAKTLTEFIRVSESREAELMKRLREKINQTNRLVMALKRGKTSSEDIASILRTKRPRLQREEDPGWEEMKGEGTDVEDEDEDDTEDAQSPNF